MSSADFPFVIVRLSKISPMLFPHFHSFEWCDEASSITVSNSSSSNSHSFKFEYLAPKNDLAIKNQSLALSNALSPIESQSHPIILLPKGAGLRLSDLFFHPQTAKVVFDSLKSSLSQGLITSANSMV
jgi:hypothetical protein